MYTYQYMCFKEAQASCTDPESFVSEGPIFTFFLCVFFSVDEGREDHHYSRPSAGHNRPASETQFKCRFAGVPMMVQN